MVKVPELGEAPKLSRAHPQVGRHISPICSRRQAELSISRRFLISLLPLWMNTHSRDALAEVDPLYDKFADNYDSLDDGPLASSLGMEQERRDLLKFAYGSVLECGAGTGINLQHYDFANIESLVSVDLSGKMLNQASKKRIDSKGKEISFAIADVEKLPFSDRSFDTIVDTFSLCVYPDPYKAISEMKRVLKDDGQLLLLEHSRSNVPLLGMYQDITAVPIARFGGKGCVWNQNVQQILSDNGLQVSAHDQYLNGLISSFQAHKIL